MDKRYSTIIFVPHARAKFRKLKVSHRLLFSLLSLLTSSLCLSTFFSIQYFTSLSQTHELSKLQRENRELQSANEQFSKSVESLRTLRVPVIYREYDLSMNEVYLPHSTDKVVRIRPAFGETRRNPQKFVAIVLMDGNEKRSKSVAIHAGQKLMVM